MICDKQSHKMKDPDRAVGVGGMWVVLMARAWRSMALEKDKREITIMR